MILPPWALAAARDGYRNFPEYVTIDETFHPWKRCDNSTRWHIAATALRTTQDESAGDALNAERDKKSKRRRKEWEEEERSRLVAGRKARRPPAGASQSERG